MICSIKTTLSFLLIINVSSVMGFHDTVGLGLWPKMPRINRGRFTCPPFKETAPGQLGMVVLPSREVCIRGQKINNSPLPDDPQAQFEILESVASWFNPCTHKKTKLASRHCFRIQRTKLSQMKTVVQPSRPRARVEWIG